jgi:carbon-monoxide dehydrogenase medium subunit
MYAFTYHQPTNVAAAAALLGDDAKLLAGGQTLLPTMKQRLAAPASLVDLGKIGELSSVSRQGDEIVIGAMTPHADVAASAAVHQAIPARRDDRRSGGAQPRHDRRFARQQ